MVVCFAAISVMLRILGRAGTYAPLFTAGLYYSLGMALLLAGGLVLGRGAAIAQPLVPNFTVLGWFFGVMIAGLTIFAQSAQTFALRTLGATTGSIVSAYGSLLFGLIGTCVLGESLSPSGIVAALILVLGLFLGVVPLSARGMTRSG